MAQNEASLEQWQADFVKTSYANCMRVSTLGDQPAPWLKRGLEILEAGEDLT